METLPFPVIVSSLKKAIETSQDKRFLGYYSEYLVAEKITNLNRGFQVEVFKKHSGVDLRVYDPNKNLESFVEVKSSSIDQKPGWCCASFGEGNSIKKGYFQTCIFVVFEKLMPKEYLIFTLDELKQITKEPRGTYVNNPYVLFRFKDPKEYEGYKDFQKNPNHKMQIEITLHQQPELFKDRWDKIQFKPITSKDFRTLNRELGESHLNAQERQNYKDNSEGKGVGGKIVEPFG